MDPIIDAERWLVENDVEIVLGPVDRATADG
jgi:hypothetical protein